MALPVSRSECQRATSLKPTTPARPLGMVGATVSVYAVCPDGSRTDASDVPKAWAIAAAGPWTGSSRPLPAAGPTVSPSPVSQSRTPAIADGLGPKRLANWPGARYWRYSADPGVETAATNAARAGGAGTGSVTSAESGWSDGSVAPTTAPSGTAGAAASGTRPAVAAGVAAATVPT